MSRVVQPLLAGLELKQTIASKRGQQWVEQCAWCGTLVCVSSSGAERVTRGQLGACPACGQTKHGWSLQHVPEDGLGMFKLEEAP